MTTKLTARAALLASLLLPAVAVSGSGAFAQTQPPAETTTPTAPATPKPKTSAPKAMSPADRVEKHITDLHAQLHITPAQQTEWDQFAQVMRENAANMSKAMEQRRSTFDSMNAADNMQSYAQIAQQHAENMQKLATTFKALYAVMSDDQKKNADEVFRNHGAAAPHHKR